MTTFIATPPPSLGANIREARKAHCYSQDDLARLTGFSRAYLGRVETNRAVLSLPALFILADALHTSASALLGGVTTLER